MGNLLQVLVHSAGWSDAAGGTWLLLDALWRFRAVLKVWADGAYEGELVTLMTELFGVDLDIVKKEEGQKGFAVQPRRWAVERSLGWYSRNRRLGRDYEDLCSVSETIVYIASIQTLLKRLRPNPDLEIRYDHRHVPRAS